MRADGPSIAAPPFPRNLPWINVATLRMDQQGGFPVLVEFWDFCRVNSLRTLPYLKAWHERYADDGLRIIGIHTGGFAPARVEENVRRAVERLEIPWAVGIDTELEVWDIYGNKGWPARYLWSPDRSLFSLHYGEGAYVETELEIQELLGVSREPLDPVRPEDAPDALIAAQTEDQPGAYSGPYEAGAVWAVVEGAGVLRVNGTAIEVTEPGCIELIAHERHTVGNAGARGRRGRDRPRHLLHPGPGLSTSCPRSPRSRTSRGGPVVVHDHRGPRPVRGAVGRRADEVRLVDPRAGVDDARTRRRGPFGDVVLRATGRSGASGPR